MSKRCLLTDKEWNLLDDLTTAAKMDWFYLECYDKHGKTISLENLLDASVAFMVENLGGFDKNDVLELYELFARHNAVDSFMRHELLKFLKNA